jgi:hypothetical protein
MASVLNMLLHVFASHRAALLVHQLQVRDVAAVGQ